MQCYCDRLWSGSDDIFHFGCMYPGAEDGKFVPFACPMDHYLSPSEWAKSKVPHSDAAFLSSFPARSPLPPSPRSNPNQVPYRDAAFLSSPAMAHTRVVDTRLVPRAEIAAEVDSPSGAASPSVVALALGSTDAELRRRLKVVEDVAVIRLPHARGLLCQLESAAEIAEVNRLSSRLLRVPQWCAKCYQPCATQLLKWLSPSEIAAGGGEHGNSFCMNVQPAPPFRDGTCVSNEGRA